MSKPRRKPSSVPSLDPSSSASESRPSAQSLLNPAIWAGLVVTIFIVYGQVGHFDFIHYDDPAYVNSNPHVEAGLTLDTLRWAFTAVVAGNWSPVTLLSHAFVCQFFRLQSGVHHLMNVVFHAAAAVLLLAALQRASWARWPSAFVAFVFALHPLHVESVAWVSERKDVLSALFWFLALYAYVRYAEHPGIRRYLVVVASLCLGLMSKTMLVTFPFTLLLFDIWPLRRVSGQDGESQGLPISRLVWEKLPLFAVCAGFSVVAYVTQKTGGAISEIPLGLRSENALLSYLVYLGQTLWPVRLAWFYPYPDSIPAWQAGIAVAVLAAVSVLVVLAWRTRPYLATGWFWYLGTLVPVIGLVQIGAQAHADRYTYIPMVGLSIMVAWGAAEMVERWPSIKYPIAAAGVASCLACMAIASQQTAYWQDGATLFQHAVDAGGDNYWARYNLALAHYTRGNELMNGGRRLDAIPEFEEVLRVRPNWAEAHNNLAILLANVPGRAEEALGHFEAAVRLDPNLAQAQLNLGMVLMAVPGRTAEAITHLEAAQRLHPDPGVAKLIEKLRATH